MNVQIFGLFLPKRWGCQRLGEDFRVRSMVAFRLLRHPFPYCFSSKQFAAFSNYGQ
jgi:hypothetical protein